MYLKIAIFDQLFLVILWTRYTFNPFISVQLVYFQPKSIDQPQKP